MSSTQEIGRGDKRRIAVIAFHGVADQKPRETAQAIAAMLLSLPGTDEGRIYSEFKQSELRIPVEGVLTAGKPSLPQEKPRARRFASFFSLDPRSQSLKELHQKEKGESAAAKTIQEALRSKSSIVQAEERTSTDTLDHQYTRDQLADYSPREADLNYGTSDSVYETIQLSGTRGPSSESGNENPACEVHLYEMYWADLSRVSSAALRVLVDFYQLLAYLCSMGRKSLDFARAAFPYSVWWKPFSFFQLNAERALTLAVPALNLCLLGLLALLLPYQVIQNANHKVAIAVLVLSALAAATAVTYLLAGKASGRRWPWLLLFPLAAGALGAYWLIPIKDGYGLYSILAFGWWLLMAALIWWAMKAYNRRVLGALLTGTLCLLGVSIAYAIELVRYGKVASGMANRIFAASAETAGWIGIVLVFVWFIALIFALFTSVAGFCVARFATADCPEPDQDAARRAIWTANLTLFLPIAITLLASLAVWKGLNVGLNRWPKFHDPAIVFSDASLWSYPVSFFHLGSNTTTVTVLSSLINAFASGWFSIFFIVFALSAVIAVWSVLPAITSKNAPGQTEEASTWLGEALSAGYRALRVPGELVRLVLFVGTLLILALLIWCLLTGNSFFDLEPKSLKNAPILSIVGLTVWLMLVASQGPFRFLALGTRGAIDIALDVANWLRLHPKDSNPKARISARCVSQLEYLARWRDPRDGGRYDALVIIAHSQGSVIATELLRFLQVEKHALLTQLTDRKIYLFTMGCPLRQLYSLRFPHQYAWARHNSAQWAGTHPDPAHLGIAEWVNAYRSGDYVGRYLWHPDIGKTQWGFAEYPLEGNNTRREFCIGAGDHTHYWDKTAPKIAEELDRLIARACSGF